MRARALAAAVFALVVLPHVAAVAQDADISPPIPQPHPVRIANEPASDFADAAFELFGVGGGGGGVTSPEYLIEAAYGRLQAGNVSAGLLIAAAIPDPAGLLMTEWLVAIGGYADVDAARMAEAAQAVFDWPARILMQIRYEQAVRRGEPAPEEALAELDDLTPILEPTILLLARSYLAIGSLEETSALVRGVWRDDSFSMELEEALLSEFGDFLSIEDHRWRMSRLFYDGATEAALRTAALLSPEMQSLAAAWAAVNRGANNAGSLLAAVPVTIRSDPGYLFARFRYLIRIGNLTDAAEIALDAPDDPGTLIDPEAWSSWRRDLARALIESDAAQTAYEVLAGHPQVDRGETSEVEFLAGWTALRFLDDPARAIPHFETLSESSSLPLSQSRAHYWLGRCYDELGSPGEAEEQYRLAARYHLSFYGQLAIQRLGGAEIQLEPETSPDETVIDRFFDNDIVQSMSWLDGLGRRAEADLMARHLAGTLVDPDEIHLLAQLAELRGDYQLALQIGKLASNRGVAVDAIAFPMAALPDDFESEHSELALIYAIARQESAFDNEALSTAGALGLLQMLPATAREMAFNIGVPFSRDRLTDPEYNATLGGAYLRTLLDRYRGSLVLALAAFNAGLSRADRWIEIYGDPRNADVDAIDWIERIPFDETRNYVQRV
ncbi:MAG: transglycosylase SLT domain-containing protein, partial [Alphaproteobacteria bacterium]